MKPGGRIGVESEAGEGSRFWFTLPLWRIPRREAVEEDAGPADPEKYPTHRKILVAEDNEENLSLILDMLHVYDHEITVAKNGIEAVDLARQLRPELILMDARMPEMDGIEATRELRKSEECRHVPIIAVTASVDSETIQACLSAGCNAHLGKPLESGDLYSVLKRFLPDSA